MILRKLKQEDKKDEIQELINKYTNNRRYDQTAVKDKLPEIIKRLKVYKRGYLNLDSLF